MSQEFKVGDSVEILGRKAGGHQIGDKGIISKLNYTTYSGEICHMVLVESKGSEYFSAESDLKLLTNKTKSMSKLNEIFKSLSRTEPEKSFVKVGITDKNDELTPEGTTLFLSYLLEKNKADFNATVVQPLLAEQEKECNH